MTIIDLFSKYAYTLPILNKSAISTRDALTTIIKVDKPKQIQSDNGGEFRGEFHQLLLDNKIEHIFTMPYTPTSNGAVERFNQTLKKLIWAHFGKANTTQWYGILQAVTLNYNTTRHSATGFKPSELHFKDNDDNNTLAYQNIVKQAERMKERTKIYEDDIKKGDKVRVYNSLLPGVPNPFDKSYLPKWSLMLYTVDNTSGGRVHLIDINGAKLKNSFFPHQLQKVTEVIKSTPVPVSPTPKRNLVPLEGVEPLDEDRDDRDRLRRFFPNVSRDELRTFR